MRIKKSDKGYEITFEYKKQLTIAAKKLAVDCDGEYIPRRKSFLIPLEYESQVTKFGNKYGFVFTEERKKSDYTLPPMPELTQDIPLKMNLYPYQRQGVAYCIEKKRVVIGDKMGLG